jgi:hypothetical protein
MQGGLAMDMRVRAERLRCSTDIRRCPMRVWLSCDLKKALHAAVMKPKRRRPVRLKHGPPGASFQLLIEDVREDCALTPLRAFGFTGFLPARPAPVSAAWP